MEHVDLAIGFNRLMPTDAEQAIREEFGPQIGACERLYEYAKGLTTSWPGRLIENTSVALAVGSVRGSMATKNFYVTTPTMKSFAGLYPPTVAVLKDEEPHRLLSR